MMVNCWSPLFLIGWIAVKNSPGSHNASVDFVQPDLVPELHGLACFLAADDVSMWLKETDNLLLGGHTLALEHTTYGLVEGLLDTE
jgi:hypothetical protein